jgi:hypothetical protein
VRLGQSHRSSPIRWLALRRSRIRGGFAYSQPRRLK